MIDNVYLHLEPNPERDLDAANLVPTSFAWAIFRGDHEDDAIRLEEGTATTARNAALQGVEALLRHLPPDLDAKVLRDHEAREARRAAAYEALTTPDLSDAELSHLTGP